MERLAVSRLFSITALTGALNSMTFGYGELWVIAAQRHQILTPKNTASKRTAHETSTDE